MAGKIDFSEKIVYNDKELIKSGVTFIKKENRMKSSFKISVSVIGLVTCLLLSATVSPAAKKIAPIDYIVEESGALSGQNEFFEEIRFAEINNDFEILEVKDESILPTEVKKKPVVSIESQNSSQQKPSSSASQKPSSQNSVSQKPSSQPSSQGSSTPPQVSSQQNPVNPANKNEQGEILKFKSNGTTYSLPVKEALKRIVSNEINEQMHYEAIKAQAVAAHTYVKYYNDQGSIPSLGAKTSYTKGGKIDRAVEEVYNVIMTYNGKAIYSPYHSSAGGRTQSSKEVWGGARAYLVSVESKYDYLADYYNLSSGKYTTSKIKNNYLATKTVSLDTVKSKMQNNYGITPSGDPSTWFKITSYSSGGYVAKASICGKSLGGNKIRTLFNLRSANFEVSYNGSAFVFTTKGYGHGVGLSQWGAHFYADKDKWNYQQILTHYFTGIKIAQVA